MENQKTISLQELMFGVSIKSKYLPTKIEYQEQVYQFNDTLGTYENEERQSLKIDSLGVAIGSVVKVIEDEPSNINNALIEKIIDKIGDLRDELSNVQNAIDDIDIRYQIDEANERADNLDYEIGELEDLVNELRGE